jgi:uncharacterized protein YcfL
MKKIFIFFIITLLLISCSKESADILKPEHKQDLTISEAKKYYENHVKKARKDDGKEEYLVFWDDATEIRDKEHGLLISVPILYKDGLAVKIKNEDNKPEVSTIDIKATLIFKKEEDKVTMYHHKMVHDYSKLDEEQSQQDTSDKFTGYAYLFDENDKFIEMSFFEKGEEKYRSVKENEKARVASYPVYVCTDWYTQVCWSGGCGDWHYSHSQCEFIYIPISSGSGSSSINTTVTLVSGGGGSVSSFSAFEGIDGYWNWYGSLNDDEKAFFKRKFWLIPYAITARIEANIFTGLVFCRNDDDGNWNAFKHALWSALNAMYMGRHNAIDIGMNHELEYIEGYEVKNAMDIHNNNKGINIYFLNSSAIDAMTNHQNKLEFIIEKVLIALNSGQLKRLNPPNSGVPYSQIQIPTNGDDKCI